MADSNKYLDKDGLEHLLGDLKNLPHAPADAQANVIEEISLNGQTLTPVNKKIDIPSASGTKVTLVRWNE